MSESVLEEYSKEFLERIKLVEFQYGNPYEWPEMDTLRYEICGCIGFGLNQAAITLTNHLLESLLKYSLAYTYAQRNEKSFGSESELVNLVMQYTDEGLKKYGKETLSKNIDEAEKVGLIDNEEADVLHFFRKKFRNPFWHSDKEGTFGNLSVPVASTTLQGNELLSNPEVEVEMAKMPIFHGLVQAQIAEIEAPSYFIKMDEFVRNLKRRVFPKSG